MRLFACAALTGGAAIGMAAPLMAQAAKPVVSRPVVQPLPPASADDLNDALLRLARNTRDLNALLDAGTASLKLGDVDAAIGFFGRAEELSPGDPRVKVGLAGAFMRSERPLEALRLFEEAERAGASTDALAGDRGLAYDLVGDNVSAQAQYRLALATRPNEEFVHRLALSQAIGGNRAGFEQTLLPLLEQRDLAAYRVRAFGLAILGEVKEAEEIAEAVMPRQLAAQVVPYLRYMPRLTRAQQAAAANLGIFPRAAEIGRDDPRIAQYTGNSASDGGVSLPATVANAGARLAPAGEPLGPRGSADAEASDRRSRAVERQAAADRARAREEASGDAQRPAVSYSVGRKPLPARPAVAVIEESLVPRAAAQPSEATLAAASAELPPQPRPTATFGSDRPASLGLGRAQPEPAVSAPAEIDLEDAFAEFAVAPPPPQPSSSGIDITSIDPPREVEAPPPPAHPSRAWVQVATGRDRDALAFDWRRITRNAGDLLKDVEGFVAAWGETNRLLAGPFASAAVAQDTVTALKAQGIDSFPYTSETGEQVDPI